MATPNSQNSEPVVAKSSKRPTRIITKVTPHMPAHLLAERWFLIDASDAVVGRLAVVIAKLLMGKDLPSYNPGVDAKTNVIVINAGGVRFTGNKHEDKQYVRHTGYLGGLKVTTPKRVLEGKQPEEVLRKAVYGMVPKNKLRHNLMDRLKLYNTAEHPHGGQQPVVITLK